VTAVRFLAAGAVPRQAQEEEVAETNETTAVAPKPHLRPGANTVREYETVYLLKADLTPEQIEKVKERVRGIVEREHGRVIKFTTWGRKKTAFAVAKQNRAVFVHVDYLGDGRAVSEVERNLRNLEEVTKFQTIKLSDAVMPESRPTEQDVVLEGDREDERPPRESREGEGFGEEGRGDSREDRESAEEAEEQAE
jgi:small subunit ribosomal protein S6